MKPQPKYGWRGESKAPKGVIAPYHEENWRTHFPVVKDLVADWDDHTPLTSPWVEHAKVVLEATGARCAIPKPSGGDWTWLDDPGTVYVGPPVTE